MSWTSTLAGDCHVAKPAPIELSFGQHVHHIYSLLLVRYVSLFHANSVGSCTRTGQPKLMDVLFIVPSEALVCGVTFITDSPICTRDMYNSDLQVFFKAGSVVKLPCHTLLSYILTVL